MNVFSEHFPLLAIMATLLTRLALAEGSEFTRETALPAAAQGNLEALYFVGKCYSKGDQGFPKDFGRAADCLLQAAKGGHAYAQNDLAVLYAKGQGVSQDFVEAAKWYQKAATQGDPLAQYSMGRICQEGRGVACDPQQSLAWYRKAAAQNQPDALLALGECYREGLNGVTPDGRQAFDYYQKAARQGRSEAFNTLGFLFENGMGFDENGSPLERSPGRAVACYRQAAEQGNGRGQTNLGRMYLNGWGVELDLVEAYKWFSLAVKSGDPTAGKFLRDFETTDALSPEELAEGERRACRFEILRRAQKARPHSPISASTNTNHQ